MKITAKSPANIAFIKYWGRSDHDLFIPRNDNISMNMDSCYTITTAELDPELNEDIVEIKFHNKDYVKLENDSIKAKNIFDQIERIRKEAGSDTFVRIKSENNFPADAGIASSASGFSALTAVLLKVYGLDVKFDDKEEFSRQIRLCGSGSAVRSAMDGFVEFKTGKDHESSHAVEIADEKYWDLVDIVAIVDETKKRTSSSRGHMAATSSPYFEARIEEMQDRIEGTRRAILEKDFSSLGRFIEEDAISMHAVMMTSVPPIYYWSPGTIEIINAVRDWREDGLESYFTIDAGANVHVICEAKNAEELDQKLRNLNSVEWTIVNKNSVGTQIINEHLF